MKITIPMILNKLNKYEYEYKYIPYSDELDYTITNIKPFKKNTSKHQSNILYITTSHEFLENNIGSSSLNLICICDSYNESPNIKNNVNLVLLKSIKSTTKIISEVEDIIAYYNNCTDVLIKALADDKGIQYIADLMYDYLQMPFTVCDSNSKVLAYTKLNEDKNDLWTRLYNENTENGYVSPKEYSHLRKLLTTMNMTKQPYYFKKDEKMFGPYLCTNIISKNKNIGTFSIFELDKPITQGIIDFSVFLSTILSLELQKNELIRYNNGVKYAYFLVDLLDGKSITDHSINMLMNYLNISIQSNFFLLILDSINQKNFKELSFIKTKLNQYMYYNISIIYNGRIVILQNDKADIELILKSVVELLDKYKMKLGISESYCKLSNTKKHYIQAIKAIEIGSIDNYNNNIYNYKDYKLYHFINLCNKQEDIEHFYHNSLLKLIAYDKKKQTNFTKTLYSYIESGKSLTNAGLKLNLHRSSLLYRINKIEEIMQVDLNNYKTFFHIQLTFELLKYKGELNI